MKLGPPMLRKYTGVREGVLGWVEVDMVLWVDGVVVA